MMRIRAAKGIGKNWFTVTRSNGTESSWSWPSEGPRLPHDLCHFVAEKTFGVKNGFWGLIEQGVDFYAFNGTRMRQKTGAWIKGLEGRDTSELLLAEALAAAVGRKYLYGSNDPKTFVEYVRGAVENLKTSINVELTEEKAMEAIRTFEELEGKWLALEEREGVDLEW